MPKVSVIMPSFNKEKYISKAIQSIINQTFQDWELIVIDDASTDRSVAVIESFHDYRIKFIKNKKNIGMAKTRNIGLYEARGQYIALLDADDISVNFRLEKEVEFLDKFSEFDVVFGGVQNIDENDRIQERYFNLLRNPDFIKASLLVKCVIPNGSCMYRKAFVNKYNILYRDDFYGMDDYMFWVECSLHGRITSISEVLLYWRNTSENSTKLFVHSEKYKEKRKKKRAEIHKYALEKTGFDLTENELVIYNKIFSEYKYYITKKQEIIDILNLLKKLINQSEGMSNSVEVKKLFKRQFGLCLENSYIWNLDV